MKYNNILQIESKEWFDRVCGNSYFSARVYLDDELVATLPFQYGYGDHYIDMVGAALDKKGILKTNGRALWSYCNDENIKLITNKQDRCLKREVVAFGSES